jgi:hypothetical protein
MKSKVMINRALLFCSHAIIGSFVIAATQSLGINIVDILGGLLSGLAPFIWEYAQGVNKRIGDTENIVDGKVCSLNGKIDQFLINLQNCATDDEIKVLQAEIYATKAIAHQGTSSATIAFNLSQVNQDRLNSILSEGTLAKTEYRLGTLEAALKEFRDTQHTKGNNESHIPVPE